MGDAFVTTTQESAYAAATQTPEMHGPPIYFTPDRDAAKASAEMLAALELEIVVTGHGRAMRGQHSAAESETGAASHGHIGPDCGPAV